MAAFVSNCVARGGPPNQDTPAASASKRRRTASAPAANRQNSSLVHNTSATFLGQIGTSADDTLPATEAGDEGAALAAGLDHPAARTAVDPAVVAWLDDKFPLVAGPAPRRQNTHPRTLPCTSTSSAAPQQDPPSPYPTPQTAVRIRSQVRELFLEARRAERSGRWPKARELLRQCLELDPTDGYAWLALARLEGRTGRETAVRTARLLFRTGLQMCPANVHMLQAWAVMENKHGDPQAARSLFARGLHFDPHNPYICQAWGILEQRLGNPDRARQLFRECVHLKPQTEVCLAWAVMEAREGKHQKARDLFQLALDAAQNYDPQSNGGPGGVLRRWAEMEERLGHLKTASELLVQAIQASPNAASHAALAKFEARRGADDRAAELMRTAVSLIDAEPSVFNSWASLQIARGNLDSAYQICLQGIDRHRRDASILQTMAIVQERRAFIPEARQLLMKSVDMRPTAPAFVAWALLEERQSNSGRARLLFEEALKVDPLHGAAYNAYGMMETRQGNIAGARDVYKRGLRKGITSSSVLQGYGQLELIHGRDIDRARQLFKIGVQQTRDETSFVWHSWGMLELQDRRPKAARQVFLKALVRYPRNSRILVGTALAMALGAPGVEPKLDDAKTYFERGVAEDPAHGHAWQCWGVFELRQGNVSTARDLFKRGLELSPRHGALWQAWAVLEASEGLFDKSRSLFAKGLVHCPKHIHLYQAWACMEVRGGNADKARELLDMAIEIKPSHGPLWTAYGVLESRLGSIDAARKKFNSGMEHNANHAPLYRSFAQTEMRAGNYERARNLFKEGLKVDPRNAPLYHALAELEGTLGNFAALAELRASAVKNFGPNNADSVLAGLDDEEYSVLESTTGSTAGDLTEIEAVLPETDMERALREGVERVA